MQGKDGTPRDIAVPLNDENQKAIPAARGGDAIRLINERIGYADLERIESSELDGMFDKFQQTAAIIFDLRGYPRHRYDHRGPPGRWQSSRPVAELFRNLVGIDAGTGVADGHISYLESEMRVSSATKPRYKGKTVALIDGFSRSLTGESAMCFKAMNSILVGNTTFPVFASYSTVFDVPGGIKMFFSGQIPRWPNGKMVLPEGVQPDVEARPTIAGIRAGWDEVLDAAVEDLGRN